MLTMNYTVGGVTTDISRYVDWTSVQISEQINIPTTLTFNVTNYDNLFPAIVQRAYVQLLSNYYTRSLFTGYLSSQPNATYKALQAGTQVFEYAFICTSDEHILNCKSVPFIPAFIDQTQGQVLTKLADMLCPGMFDTSMVGSGDIEPYYNYDPNKSWCEIAKDFADGSRYRYHVRDKKIWFQPYGDGLLGISYDETLPDSTFDPNGLQTQVLAVPLVNDVTIIGDVEAGNSREDYFIGDGFTGNFPLRHKVFRGSSTLLASDDWTGDSFNAQQWDVQPPNAPDFNLGVGALNIVTSQYTPKTLGTEFIQLNNGLELAGGIDLEHGEFGFNDYSDGIIGGIYTESLDTTGTYQPSGCIGGFYISTPGVYGTSASGAFGINIQPTWRGMPLGLPIVTQKNHTYVLQTVITAPAYVRYNRWYRSLAGNAYGGVETECTGNVTFIVQDFDIAAATGFFYLPNITKYSASGVDLPAFAAYGLINNHVLNLTVNYTTLATMPLGSLSALEGPSGLWMPTGLVLPLLPPDSGDYAGPVFPWPSDASGGIYQPPLTRGASHQEVLGNGFELQAAQITQGNEADVLAFYAQSLPTAGTPVRLLTWESQAAISRLQSSGSIAQEAYVVGDNGIRSAIVSNLSPLPRTSEDCDSAAQAFLDDRTNIFYNGSYDCTSYFIKQSLGDEQFWPTCGRYLRVNCPARGIANQNMLVTKLTISVLDPVGNPQPTLTFPYEERMQVGEVLRFQIGFGADLHLEKVLFNFVDIQPPNVLAPKDTAEQVNPRYGYQVDNYYLPDLKNILVDPITYNNAAVVVNDPIVAPIEIRTVDGNWGKGATSDYVGTQTGAAFNLVRNNYEQIWYMRFVDPITKAYSRRSKVVRITYPVKPLPPTVISVNSNFVQLDFNGDIRNVYGVEVRPFSYQQVGIRLRLVYGEPILQQPVESYGDLNIDLTKTVNTAPFSNNRQLAMRFFNHQWEYSEYIFITIPTPDLVSMEEGYRFGRSLDVMCAWPDRSDILNQHWQVAQDPAFSGIIVDLSTNYAGNLKVNVPASSDLWVRCALTDYIGSGDWFPLPIGFGISGGLHIPLGDLLASDYLAEQGSVPPIITTASGAQIYPEDQGGSASTSAFANSTWATNGITPVTEETFSTPIAFGSASLPYGVGSTISATVEADMNLSPNGGIAAGVVEFQISYTGPTGPWGTIWSFSSQQSSIRLTSILPGTGDLGNTYVRVRAYASAQSQYYSGLQTSAWTLGSISNISITLNLGGTGSVATYIATSGSFEVHTVPFQMLYPNGVFGFVPESSGIYTTAKDTGNPLSPGTYYSFYLSMLSAAYASNDIFIDGPYAQPSQSALAYSVQDGRLALSAGALKFQTASGSSTAVGAGGGSYGSNPGANAQFCGVLTSRIRMADGSEKMLRETEIGDMVDNGVGGVERIEARKIVSDLPIRTVTVGKYTSRAAIGHTLETEHGWANLLELEDFVKAGTRVLVSTKTGQMPIDSIEDAPSEDVLFLTLSGPAHTYVLDGLKTHNTLYKTAG